VRRSIVKVALAMCVVVISASCGSGSSGSSGGAGASHPTKPLIIGLVDDFSGVEGFYGPESKLVSQLAIDDINAAGGVWGQPVKLVIGDGASNPQQELSEAQRLINVEGAQVLISAGNSGECLSAEQGVATPTKTLLIGTLCVSPAMTVNQHNKQGYFFRIRSSIDGLVGPIAKLMAHDKVTQVCDMYADNAYGQGADTTFQKLYPQFLPGASIIRTATTVDTVPSRMADLQKCTANGHNTMAALMYGVGEGDQVLKEGLENNLITKAYMGEDFETSQIFQPLGWQHFDGWLGVSGAAVGANLDSMEQEYQAKNGVKTKVPLTEMSYDGVVLAALAAAKANSTDRQAIRDAVFGVANGPGDTIDVGPNQIKRALSDIASGKSIDYAGVSGVQYLDNGEPVRNTARVWRIDATQQAIVQEGYVVFDATALKFQYTPLPTCKLVCDPSIFG
jgi:branched-chain amino acid transport system substrate-binding protein